MDTLRPRSDAVDQWESKRGKGEARADSAEVGELARTRSDRAVHPESSIRGKSCDWRSSGAIQLDCANRDAVSCNLRSRIRGARLNPSTDLALQECAVVPLRELAVGGAELNSSGVVRARNIAHQCSEEEPLAETENHRH